MKLTLPWLKEFLETDLGVEEISKALTDVGLEVEGIIDQSKALDAFSVAYVKTAIQHPNADRLRVCEVETKEGVKNIVCGAPNAREGIYAIYAPVGSTIPANGFVLTKSEIRGVESEGMLCSARELGIGDEHDGIIELPKAWDTGIAAFEALELEGPVIDIAITPDRSDCFGIWGIARDLAAAGCGRLIDPFIETIKGEGEAGRNVSLDFPHGDEKACPAFASRLVRGVKNGESPPWLKKRLMAVGLRPISALVDITNYATIALNRPLHVFDDDRLDGDLTVRFAAAGEKLLALDGKEYELNEHHTVIADQKKVHSLGGIMGGEESGCDENTRNVLIEAALFDPLRTARTGRFLGIDSDARTRFERGIDPAFLLSGMEWATKMVVELCGGKPAPVKLAGSIPESQSTIHYRKDQLSRLGGIELDDKTTTSILSDLGFKVVDEGNALSLTVPSWRHDVSTEACIVEELSRVHGYDKIPPMPVTKIGSIGRPLLSRRQAQIQDLRRLVSSLGYSEAVTWSFLEEEWAKAFTQDALIHLANPISSELSVMRPSLLPNLLVACARNQDKGETGGSLFELGVRFKGGEPGQQTVSLAGMRFGQCFERHWLEGSRAFDLYDAKKDLLAALEVLGIRVNQVKAQEKAYPFYHPHRSGVLTLGPKILAHFGEIHPKLCKERGLEHRAVAFEFDLDALPKAKVKPGRTRPALQSWPYPHTDRDFAFIVDHEVASGDLVQAVTAAEKKLIKDVSIFDVYQGNGVEEGKKSIGVAVRFQSRERTLSDQDIEPVAAKIVASVEKRCHAKLRD